MEDGSFEVRGTVRDPTNEKKIKPLRENLPNFDQLTLVQADLLDAESIMKAVEGADIVIHTASPFPLDNPKNEQDLIKPAVEGTLAVMRACHFHKVKRVVITSSIAAVADMKPENMPNPKIFNETHWSDITSPNI